MRRHSIAYLAGYLYLTANKLEIVRKSHQACSFTMRYWPMLFRVEIAPFLRLKKLGPYRNGRPIPPQAPKQIRSTTFFPNPTFWRYMRRIFLQIKPIATRRDCSIPLHTHRSRVAAKMEIQGSLTLTYLRSLRVGQIRNGVFHCPPTGKIVIGRRRRVSSRWGKFKMGTDITSFPPHDNRSSTRLRGTVIRRIKDFRDNLKSQVFRTRLYVLKLR